MSQDRPVVGKNVLESLTMGMYEDNRIIFREYIQNAADAIDKAVAKGVLNRRDDGRIDVTIDAKKKEIRIRDNGIGIPSEKVHHSLKDIGKSEKDHVENRGFRGIGRLGGLGYCNELKFITSYKGEERKTTLLWDCNELKRLLQPNVGQNMSVIDVVEDVTIIEPQPEENEAHYFEVVLTDVDSGHDNLLDFEDVKSYLSQVAPVPFDYKTCIALQKINAKLRELNKEPEEFRIFLQDMNDDDEPEQLYKPYKVSLLVNPKKKDKTKNDHLKDVFLFKEYDENEELLFLGWYGETDLSAIIKDNEVNGLRFRLKNIQIGNNRTADDFFGAESNRRFNRWFVGEIYVFNKGLIPNARRDDFEKNPTYFYFKEKLEKVTKELIRLPYASSKVRKNERTIREVKETVKEVEEQADTAGITEAERKKLLDVVDKTSAKIEKVQLAKKARPIIKQVEVDDEKKSPDSHSKNDTASESSKPKHDAYEVPVANQTQQIKEEILENLKDLKNKIRSKKERPSDHIPSSYSRKEREIVDKIFEVIDLVLVDPLQVTELKNRIIEELQITKKGE